MSRSTRLLLAALALFLTFVPVASADFVGSNTQDMTTNLVVPRSGWDAYGSRMSSDGLKIARIDASWGATEATAPSNGVHNYQWGNLDSVVGFFARHGIRVSAGLSFPPSWASGPGTKIAQSHYGDFAAFSGAFAARYGVNGSFWAANPNVPKLPIADYEVWTEANSTLYWTGAPADPADYLNALKQVSAKVRASDPGAQVLASLGWQNSTDFVNKLYAAGLHGSIDGFAYHPYSPTGAGITSLVSGLRDVMRANGDGDLPIDVTEIGQPVSSPGADSATKGYVSDAARAATQSFAAEAIGRSNCNVGDYLIFTLVGSETGREPIGEGFMGIYSIHSPTPNITGQAMIAAQQRIDAGAKGVIKACGGTTADSDLMPLQANFTHSSPRCFGVTTNYYGNPLEGATLTLSNSLGIFGRLTTDAHGSVSYCLPDDFVTPDVTLYVDVPNLARSNSVTCTTSSTACDGATPAPGAATPAVKITKGTTSTPCVPRLKMLLKKVQKKKSTLTASLRVCPVKSSRVRLTVFLQKKPTKKQKKAKKKPAKRFVRRVTATAGTTLHFSFRGRLRRGQKLQIVLPANKKLGYTRLSSTVTATKKLGAKP